MPKLICSVVLVAYIYICNYINISQDVFLFNIVCYSRKKKNTMAIKKNDKNNTIIKASTKMKVKIIKTEN